MAQLLTGSPYKNAMVEKLRLRGMGRKGASKGRAAGSRERQPSGVATSRTSKPHVRTRGGVSTRARGPRTRGGSTAVKAKANAACFCIYCHEMYQEPPTEDWLQCAECTRWFHELCGNGFNICDICDA